MNNTAPTVSIAIRAFRRAWLADAIASVLGQTFTDLELVVYDDAGDLEDVVSGLADTRVRYHRARERHQASGRLRAALALCRGRFLGLLDDDDRYEPTFIERLVQALENDAQAGIAFCRTAWDADGQRVTPLDSRPAGQQVDAARAMLTSGWTVSPSHLLIRAEAFADAARVLPIPEGVAPDVFLNLGVALSGWAHVLVDAPLVVCRWHDEQLSRVYPYANDTAVATWRQVRLDDPVLASRRNERLARALLVRAVLHLAHDERALAQRDVRDAASVAPIVWRLPRAILRMAIAAGPFGAPLARTWLHVSPRAQSRERPPTRIGDR